MNRSFGSLKIDADQIPAFNPLLVLIMVPIFDWCVYPAFAKCKIPLRPLQRMAIGMLLTSASFVVAAFVQLSLDAGDKLHVLYQLPQYGLLTCGEVMVSITGLEFAYTQAPKSMKSLLMASWLLTVAVGNLFVVIVAKINYFDQWLEFLFFAGMMLLAMILFIVISQFYKYTQDSERQKASS